MQTVAFVIVVDHVPKGLLRAIVKIRPGHQHVSDVRRLKGGSILVLFRDEKAAQYRHVVLNGGAIDGRRVTGFDE